MNHQGPHVSKHQLEEYGKLSNMPMLVFNQDKVLFANKWFLSCINESQLDPIYHNIIGQVLINGNQQPHEITLVNKKGETFYLDSFLSKVVYNKIPAYFALLYQVNERIKFKQEQAKISKLRQLIIDISQSILDDSKLDDFFDFVLKKALQASDKAQLGTILILKDDVFYVGASYGYDEDIQQFKLPAKQSFTYQQTNGKFDQIVNVKDTSGLPFYIPVKTDYGDQVFIGSSLSAPIHVQGEFYGMVNLDAIEKNAFCDEDIQSLEYIRNSIEIAITNRLLYEEKVYLSQYDQVTSLHNRYFFEKHSEYVLKRAKRYNEEFHLVIMDIDNLKQVNDTYGHVVGDMHIHQVAKTIKDTIRASDVFARYGGDEYVGLLFNASVEDVNRIFESIRLSLAQSPINHDDTLIAISISYGVATFPSDGFSINELIHVADKRMYSLKENTKNATR